MNEKEQSLIRTFAVLLVASVTNFFDLSRVEEIIGESSVKELFIPAKKRGFFGKKVEAVFPDPFDTAEFEAVVQRVVSVLFDSFGFEFTEAHLEQIYGDLEKLYSVGLVGQIITPFIPAGYLERHRIAYLSKEELEEQVLQKTRELQTLNNSLEEKIKDRTNELVKLLAKQDADAKILIDRDQELTLANEKLQELDKIKSDFISVAAHQLRTPLSGVKWTLNMLLAGDMGPLNNDQKTFLMKTYESNTRMITLVNDMLVADGIQSGRVKYEFKQVDIADLIDNVLFEVGPQAAKRSITVSYKHAIDRTTLVHIDPEAMRAVVQNLLENAVKYTPDAGKVEIGIIKEGDHLVVSIADTGIGIPPDQVKNIFVKFFRARNAVKKETDGSGLGLYIAKTTIEKNGGTVWFDSVEGKGSTFYFTVPLQV